MDWVLTDVADDSQDDRWLLVYQVPSEYAPDGTYSVSMPKDMLTDFAAAYGFDPADPDDAEAAFEYLIHLPAMQEVARRAADPFAAQGMERQVAMNPYEMSSEVARRLCEAHLAAFKRVHRIVSDAPAARASGIRPGTTVAARALAAPASVSMLDAVKADMIARVDSRRARQAAQLAEIARMQVQEQMQARALQEHEAFEAAMKGVTAGE